ncbi:uncharacterized protein LOC118187078, partial [Stegodyphus dumicola]|uniref:uncharacterized protein LOC118187078 n=1 Tax=Stegodyphus dumicola TaxID=202533 RepID=UPI0015A87B5B
MPLKPESSETVLGNSKEIALKRLDELWTRLERDSTLKTLYVEFLNEYENLHHLEEVKEDILIDDEYYLPHHGVLRSTSKTTKLRVVFNASLKTSSGHSLNDLLCKRGVLQEDLLSILIRFRKHIFAFTADIKQMFRMIEVNPSQSKLQKILWKDSKFAQVKVYQLRTVTHGTASAPYLATKVLQQLALDEGTDFPLASRAVLQDFYMDDCLSDSSDINELEKLMLELKQLLQKGGMTLHKRCSNKATTTELEEFTLDRNSEEIIVKTLGMFWNSLSDSFTYKLWLLKLDWNETLPPVVAEQWENFIKTLPHLEHIHVPRCFLKTNTNLVVLQGFSDASSKAYGAVIYIQTVSSTGEVNSTLLCSKSRVAPTKCITVPRLELCASLLLAKLTEKVLTAVKLQIGSVKLYSDPTIALAWIKTPSNLLKTLFCRRCKSSKTPTGELTSKEYERAENYLIKHLQVKYFPAEISALERESSVPPT